MILTLLQMTAVLTRVKLSLDGYVPLLASFARLFVEMERRKALKYVMTAPRLMVWAARLTVQAPFLAGIVLEGLVLLPLPVPPPVETELK